MWRMRTDPAFPRASVSPFWTESADTEAAPCWKPGAAGLASALACPPPPTILLRSSCGNGEWGRRLGGAPGCVPLRGSPRGASGRGMFPQQPGDSAAQPPAPVGGGGGSSSLPPSRAGDPAVCTGFLRPAPPRGPLFQFSSSRTFQGFPGLKEVTKMFVVQARLEGCPKPRPPRGVPSAPERPSATSPDHLLLWLVFKKI